MAAPAATTSTHYESPSTYCSSPRHANLTYAASGLAPGHEGWRSGKYKGNAPSAQSIGYGGWLSGLGITMVGQHTCTSSNHACRSDPMPTRVLTGEAGLCILHYWFCQSTERRRIGTEVSVKDATITRERTCPVRLSISGPIIIIGPRQVAECRVWRVRAEEAMTVGLVQMTEEKPPVQEASCAAHARSASEVMCDVTLRDPACVGEQTRVDKRGRKVGDG